MLWGLTHYFFSLCSGKLFSLREKVLDPGLKYCPVLMGCDMKIIKTVLGRMFLSISWLKWFIVACSTIALYVCFYKDQMWPCPALFLFVCFLINTAVKSPPGRSLSEVSERERWGATGGARALAAWGAALGLCNSTETAPQKVGGKARKPASSKCPEQNK